MLAVAMYSEYKYDINLEKVIWMLAVHELEEIRIGDLTQFQITKEEKIKIGHQAVTDLLASLTIKDQIIGLILEFDERKTKEAIFAHYCDKLECDIQSKLYDEEGCVDLKQQQNNNILNDKLVKKLLSEGKSWSDMWLTFGQIVYGYDDNFLEVSNYVKDNDISLNNESEKNEEKLYGKCKTKQ